MYALSLQTGNPSPMPTGHAHLCRLEYQGVTRCQARCALPGQHHQWVVPGNDDGTGTVGRRLVTLVSSQRHNIQVTQDLHSPQVLPKWFLLGESQVVIRSGLVDWNCRALKKRKVWSGILVESLHLG